MAQQPDIIAGLEVTEQVAVLVEDAAAFARVRPLARPGTEFIYASNETVLLTRLWMFAVGEATAFYPTRRAGARQRQRCKIPWESRNDDLGMPITH
jgi:hypothetical protein